MASRDERFSLVPR
ncbi:hypothetical protein LINPERHAP1_LOCUS36107 [Linum perenne]